MYANAAHTGSNEAEQVGLPAVTSRQARNLELWVQDGTASALRLGLHRPGLVLVDPFPSGL